MVLFPHEELPNYSDSSFRYKEVTPVKLPRVLGFVSRTKVVAREAGNSQNPYLGPRAALGAGERGPPAAGATQLRAQPVGLSSRLLVAAHAVSGALWSPQAPEGENVIGLVKWHWPRGRAVSVRLSMEYPGVGHAAEDRWTPGLFFVKGAAS